MTVITLDLLVRFVRLSRLWNRGRRVQTHYLLSVRVRSAKKAIRDAAEVNAVKTSAKCGSSSFLASKESRKGEGVERSRI